jgi:hypothetical protein
LRGIHLGQATRSREAVALVRTLRDDSAERFGKRFPNEVSSAMARVSNSRAWWWAAGHDGPRRRWRYKRADIDPSLFPPRVFVEKCRQGLPSGAPHIVAWADHWLRTHADEDAMRALLAVLRTLRGLTVFELEALHRSALETLGPDRAYEIARCAFFVDDVRWTDPRAMLRHGHPDRGLAFVSDALSSWCDGSDGTEYGHSARIATQLAQFLFALGCHDEAKQVVAAVVPHGEQDSDDDLPLPDWSGS